MVPRIAVGIGSHMSETSWVQINLGALRANAAWWRHRLGATGSRLCAVVKADAYGLGAAAVVDALAAQADMFAAFSPRQAEVVLSADDRAQRPVLVFMPVSQWSWNGVLSAAATAGRLHVSVHSRQCLREAEGFAATLHQPLPIHLFVDTGMSRGGLACSDLAGMLAFAAASARLRVAGIYTHFASADDDPPFLERQLQTLGQAASHRPTAVMLHAANTCAALRDSRFHLDMARIGLGLYGYAPSPQAEIQRQAAPLKHVLRWLSRVVHVGHWPAGAAVGYNTTHRLKRHSILALVPVGYADGYPLSLSNRGVACLLIGCHRRMAPIVGKVNMDQIILDVTDLPGVKAGDTVELISDDAASPCALPRLAELAGTSSYELLCRLSPRLRRAYVDVPGESPLPAAAAGPACSAPASWLHASAEPVR
jgi:alanine racemase